MLSVPVRYLSCSCHYCERGPVVRLLRMLEASVQPSPLYGDDRSFGRRKAEVRGYNQKGQMGLFTGLHMRAQQGCLIWSTSRKDQWSIQRKPQRKLNCRMNSSIVELPNGAVLTASPSLGRSAQSERGWIPLNMKLMHVPLQPISCCKSYIQVSLVVYHGCNCWASVLSPNSVSVYPVISTTFFMHSNCCQGQEWL